eukprot:853674_1
MTCCKWIAFNVGIFVLMTPLCLFYFAAIDAVFMIYVLFSTTIYFITFSKLDITNFIDDLVFKNIFGMNKTQIVGYRRLRTLSQLFFESIPQIILQLWILWRIKSS